MSPARAGVSYATVSCVLNDEPYVKPETRKKAGDDCLA